MQRVVDKLTKRSRKIRRPALPKEKLLELPVPMKKDASEDHEIEAEDKELDCHEVIFRLDDDDCTDEFVIKFEDTYRW
tara:strand:- start:49 stop:282 length:234 start_codon:yes stop_codon:yes gene_type:complete